MSSHASSTLARAIHLTELRRDRQRLSSQTEILRILIHCLEPEQMLDNLLLKCQEIIGAANVSLFLMDEKQTELVRTVGFNAGAKITRHHSIPVGSSITGKSAELGRAFTLNQPEYSSDYIPDLEWKGKGTVRNIMVIPLSASGATLGVLRLLNKKDGDFSHADLTLLEELAASLSVAIRNMKLHERLGQSIEAQIESNRALQKLNNEYILQSCELSEMKKKLTGVR
jgi:GAF domain-containing protein